MYIQSFALVDVPSRRVCGSHQRAVWCSVFRDHLRATDSLFYAPLLSDQWQSRWIQDDKGDGGASVAGLASIGPAMDERRGNYRGEWFAACALRQMNLSATAGVVEAGEKHQMGSTDKDVEGGRDATLVFAGRGENFLIGLSAVLFRHQKPSARPLFVIRYFELPNFVGCTGRPMEDRVKSRLLGH
ncbi:hypothetical protein B0H11DRAFT_1916733 [Mycena galericulata]|nr:hypothetical protein B0H11DRAFT_1916733 [Mycena galericulata]